MERKWLIAVPILIVLLALCVVITLIGVYTVRQVGRSDLNFSFNEIPIGAVSVEGEQEASYPIQTPARLVVENPCGKIEVRAVDGLDAVGLRIHKKVWVRDVSDGPEELEAIQIAAAPDGNNLHLALENPKDVCQRANLPSATVDFFIETPVETEVQLIATVGEVWLEGTKGPAEISSNFGNLTVRDLEGGLVIETVNGQVDVRSVDAGDETIQLKSGFGGINADSVRAASLDVVTTNGAVNVQAAQVASKAYLASDFGSVVWRDGSADLLQVNSKNGQVTLTELKINAGLEAATDFGGLTIENVSAESYTLNTKNGPIRVIGATGPVSAHSDFGDVNVSSDASVRLDLSSESGGISYTGALGDGENVLRTQFGQIHLRLPEDSSFAFDLETSFGKITNNFAITIQGSPDENHWKGRVGEGGPSLAASTDNGNIILEHP